MKFGRSETIISTSMERPSFLIPSEITEDDCKIEDEGSQNINVNSSDKKDESKTEEEDEFIVDPSSSPFKDDDEKEIEIAISGKTFEVLYKLNKKYEDYMNKKKNIINTGVVINDQKLKNDLIKLNF